MDRTLVERARDGDQHAFATIASQIGDRLHATAQHILRERASAEDAVQHALIEIWRKLPQLRDPDRFQGWAYRIVVRAAYAEASARARWPVSGAEPASVPARARDVSRTVEDRDQIERGFARLDLDHRAVLVLRHYAGLTNVEIAEALDIPEGTVRSRLYNGLQTMRAALEADARLPRETGQ